jgi:hypothetical protein
MKRKRFFSGANCGHREAGGNGDAGGRADPAGRDQRTDVLSLEEAIHRLGDRPSSSAQATAGREWQAEEVGGRTDAGPGDVTGRTAKKLVKPSCRRAVVYLWGGYRVSERRACKVVLLPRATHRCELKRRQLTEELREVLFQYRRLEFEIDRKSIVVPWLTPGQR